MRGKIIAGRLSHDRTAEVVLQIYNVPDGELVIGDEIFLGTQAQSEERISIECDAFFDEVLFRG